MNATIHPAIVHFPIALLVIYSLFEMTKLKKLARQSWYTMVKCAFLFLGTLSSYAAYASGVLAKNLYPVTPLLEEHAKWAALSLSVFTGITLCYILLFISRKAWFIEHIESRFERAGTLFPSIAQIIFRFAPAAALLGLITIIITSGLGGAIVFGPESNPITHFVYQLILK